jgi:hypothetical protein
VGDLVTPGQCFAVEVFEGRKGAGREEGMAHVLDGPFHAPLRKSRQLHAIRLFRLTVSV